MIYTCPLIYTTYNIHTIYTRIIALPIPYTVVELNIIYSWKGVSPDFFMGAVRKYIRGQFSLLGDDIQPIKLTLPKKNGKTKCLIAEW